MANIELAYQPYTPEEAAAAKEVSDISGSNSVYTPKLKVGATTYRFLPRVGSEAPFFQVSQHFAEDSTGARWSFNCLRAMARNKCPMCDIADKLRSTGNQADYERAKKMFANLRFFANVIQRDAEERGPMIFAFGKGIMDEITGIMTANSIDVTDPRASGRDINVHRTGTGQMDTKYKASPSLKTRPLSESIEEANAWLSARHNLKAMCGEILPFEIIAEALASDEKPDRKLLAQLAGATAKAAKQLAGTSAPRKARLTAEDDADIS